MRWKTTNVWLVLRTVNPETEEPDRCFRNKAWAEKYGREAGERDGFYYRVVSVPLVEPHYL